MKRILILSLFLIILSGCVRAETSINLNPDGSGEATLIMAVTKEALETEGFTSNLDEISEELKTDGYEVESVSDDEYEGIKATKKFTDINNLSFPGDEGELTHPFNLSETNEDGIKRLVIDMANELNGDEPEAEMDLSMLKSFLDLTFTVSIPGEILDNNATSIDVNVASWKLTEVNDDQFFLEFKPSDKQFPSKVNFDDSTNSLILYVLFGVMILLGLGIGFVLSKKL